MNFAKHCAEMPKRSRRILALLVVPAVLLCMLLSVYLPAAYLRNSQAGWRDEAGLLLSQAKEVERLQAELNTQLTLLQTSGLWSKFYSAGDLGAGATSLQADVSSFLGNLQVSAQSIAPIPSMQMPRFTRIGTRLTASMRIDQLQGFLSAVATHPRYLRVEQITVAAPQTQTAEDNPPLAVSLEVYGYELPRDAKSRAESLVALALRSAN